MVQKLRQVTDNIHETIYLSELESELISTPYFYRLHDIYQSSTVYLTFPANRTKRYEHSLGTMHLAGDMFHSAFSHANKEVKQKMMDYFLKSFRVIIDAIIAGQYSKMSYINELTARFLETVFKTYRNKKKKWNEEVLKTAITDFDLLELALKHQEVAFSDLDTKKTQEYVYVFIHQCALEAIRIVGLFHDAGHPPYSHVIENVLLNLENECEKNIEETLFDADKAKELRQNLKDITGKNVETVLLNESENTCNFENMEFHEKLSIKFLSAALGSTLDKNIKKINSGSNSKQYDFVESKIIYFVTVAEFAFAILQDRDTFYSSLHRIIDGCIDADRLDYIVRDTENSGVNWGKPPYRRIIDSAKFMEIEEYKERSLFVVAYPEKLTDDLVDLLKIRYQIFSRINFHHRCHKTGTTLKIMVEELALDYLKNSTPEKGEDDISICPDISILWTALGAVANDRPLDIIRWNDSWMITTLYQALIRLGDEREKEKIKQHYLNVHSGRTSEDVDEKFEKIQGLLQEILLNDKYYTTLFKRDSDWTAFIKKTLQDSGIQKKIEMLKNKEEEKYIQNIDMRNKDALESAEKRESARDSLARIAVLEKAVEQGSLQLLITMIPLEKTVEALFTEALLEKKNENVIKDYALVVNKKYNSIGVPSWEESLEGKGIYLYNEKPEFASICDTDSKIFPQILPLIKQGLWLSIYIVYYNEKEETETIAAEIIAHLSQKLSYFLIEGYNKLFPNQSIDIPK